LGISVSLLPAAVHSKQELNTVRSPDWPAEKLYNTCQQHMAQFHEDSDAFLRCTATWCKMGALLSAQKQTSKHAGDITTITFCQKICALALGRKTSAVHFLALSRACFRILSWKRAHIDRCQIMWCVVQSNEATNIFQISWMTNSMSNFIAQQWPPIHCCPDTRHTYITSVWSPFT
jgi:hypothetical protein